ncbi:putative HNHc nuclease [Anaerosporobacter faecicola]|uniref:putative HNHc nuclease n=1 Tax=Anaerosporobacter faecicola TaxID=2718714 RepID=UPI0014398789|nr:putative HNHc nuclease [Anaerosporobacter faecicola]
MYVLAKLTGYRVNQEGTELKVFIPNINLQESIETKKMRNAGIWLDDGRHISAEQRKKAYATIADISRHTGYLPEEAKEWLKYLHIARTGCDYFSLSTCTMDTAREFINTLMEFAIEHGVILEDLGVNRTDDVSKYLYYCIKHRVCAVCGKPLSDIHHCEGSRVGMGNNRNRVDNKGRLLISLCREHHTICHNDELKFFEKNHVYGIVYNDEIGVEVS